MEKRTLFNLLLSMLFLISVANAATFYDSFDFTFTGATPANMQIQSYKCNDVSCSTVSTGNVVYYSQASSTCWDTYGAVGDSAGYTSCMNGYQIAGNTINLGANSGVIAKYDTNAPFGYVNYFFTEGDIYLVEYFVQNNIQNECAYDICVDSTPNTIYFKQKTTPAIAEVGQVNVMNIDNDLLPVQVQVPVSIEETICSAFRFANPVLYRPLPPVGYSDYSANTLVTLTITDESTGNLYLNQSITIPVLADTCAGLAAFSWTPAAGMENEQVRFRVESNLIDGQIANGLMDWAEVLETIYPQDLDGTCWTRSYDFTLSNIANTNLNTSVAQISVGESLYAVFKAGAFRDNNITPMMFEAIVQFDGTTISDQLFSTGVATSEDDLQTYNVDLTNAITGLPAGTYTVDLITRPVSGTCTMTSDVEQTQNLELLNPEQFDVTFHVRDEDYNILQGANINLLLTNAEDYFVVDPLYNQNGVTNANGEYTFTGAYPGQYTYLVSMSNHTSVTNEIYVGSDMDVYITLPRGNVAPLVDLPNNLTGYYMDPLTLDMRDYVNDFNDAFSDLTITSLRVSGNIVINYNNGIFTFTTNQPNMGVVRIFAQDPSGEVGFDDITINFINNQAPIINEFSAQPDNGEEPFNTHFVVDVSDDDGDALTCTIDFGDGTQTTSDCSALNNIAHTFTLPNTYVVTLSVVDGFNTPVEAEEMVFVFNRTIESPVINDFTLTSSNGLIVPTDLTLDWNVTHSGGYPTTCTLRINGVDNAVACIGTYSIDDFNLTGVSRFHIIAIDNASTQVLRTIERTFYTDGVRLTSNDVNLLIDDVVVPGEFEFGIETTNESLIARTIDVKPIIVCEGVENKLSGAGWLTSSPVIRNETGLFTFNLVANTLNFQLRVPTDVVCTFKVILDDEFGSNLELSKAVTFSYPEDPQLITSIRGKGTDVTDYISASMAKPFPAGYNAIVFNVENNEPIAKELSITMVSQELGIQYGEEINLGPGQIRKVTIPLFIGNNVEAGMYPVRFGVYDGTDKQVRYSYITVE